MNDVNRLTRYLESILDVLEEIQYLPNDSIEGDEIDVSSLLEDGEALLSKLKREYKEANSFGVVEKLRSALRFYADKKTYQGVFTHDKESAAAVEIDGGAIARSALMLKSIEDIEGTAIVK